MTDTWKDILDVKNKKASLRERIRKRKQELQNIEAELKLSAPSAAIQEVGPPAKKVALAPPEPPLPAPPPPIDRSASPAPPASEEAPGEAPSELLDVSRVEAELLRVLADVGVSVELPVEMDRLFSTRARNLRPYSRQVRDLLQKFDVQNIVTLEDSSTDVGSDIIITNVDNAKLAALLDDEVGDGKKDKREAGKGEGGIEDLLLAQTAKERETQRLNEEIMELLNKPTTKEQSLLEKFRSQGGSQVQEFCPFSTKEECRKMRTGSTPCRKLHFRKIIQPHTDESLGDCSFLNTCFHFQTCKYVHYEIDQSGSQTSAHLPSSNSTSALVPRSLTRGDKRTTLYPPQWVQCDVRNLNMKTLGKFAVLMADPPWDIHMELPYGTMSDDEMRQLDIPCLQDDGYMFLWVTGRAMELGRECLRLWGYERVDEIIWVKTNQLQRIIRTGRTGHWINHGKEHCLVGAKGDPKDMNKGLDCDVIVSEVRATSHKPDEIYGIIERLSPGTRKLELFGRPHNVQPNWITLGNQLDGVRLLDPEVVERYRHYYPNGYTISGSN